MHTYATFIVQEQQYGEVPKGRLLRIQSSKSTKENFNFGGWNEQFGILGGNMNSKFSYKLV